MAAGRAAARPRARRSRGAPGSSCGGSRPAPGSAQCPPGSRPIESGFQRGSGAGPGGSSAPPPPGGSVRGVRRASPARPLGRRPPPPHSYYCTSLRYISFQNSTPRSHNAPRLKGAAAPAGGGRRRRRRKGPRASPALPQSRCPRRPCAGAAPWASPPSPRREGASPLGWGWGRAPSRHGGLGAPRRGRGAHRRVHPQRPAGLQGEDTGECPNFPFKSPHSDAPCHH